MKTTVVGQGRIINEKARAAMRDLELDQSRESRLAMIQMLIPLALRAVEHELQGEVVGLVGERYRHGGEHTRWGSNAGSVYLGDQKVAISVPRVRHKQREEEVQLESYRGLQGQEVLEDFAALLGMKYPQEPTSMLDIQPNAAPFKVLPFSRPRLASNDLVTF